MKKVLLSLLAVAALVLSCQNYDDEFAALNAKVAGLEAQISSLQGLQAALTTVQSSVSALQSAVNAIPDPSASIAALATSVAEILTDLGALETAVAGATTDADLDALKAELNTTLAALQALIEANSDSIAALVLSNASLKSQLEALGVDVDAVLAQNSTYTGNLTITNAAEMNFAQSLGDKVKVINGNVKIQITASNGVTAAGVSAVTKLMQTVVGNVTVETNASIDMSALTAVSGDYVVDGKDISDDALASAGDVLLDYDGGYSMPALTTAKNIFLVDYDTKAATTAAAAVVGTTSVAFNSSLKATSMQTVASGSVHSSGGGVHSSGGSISVGSYTANTVDFTDATSIVIGDVPVISVTAGDATSLELHFDGTATSGLSSLTVSGAKLTSVVAKAIKAGAVSVTMKATGSLTAASLATATSVATNAATVDFTALKTVTGALTPSGVTSLSLPALTSVGTLTAAKATSVSADALKTATTITLAKVSEVSLPAATAVTTISAELATTVSAPLATVGTIDIAETGQAISATDLTKHGATSVDVKSVTTLTDKATLTTLKLRAQAATLTAIGDMALVTSIDFSGASNAVDFTTDSTNSKLATLKLGGKLGDVDVVTSATANTTSATYSSLTTIETSGTIEDLNIQDNSILSTLTLGHTEDASNGAKFSLVNNDKLESFTTSFDRVTSFVVTGNAILADFDASSIQNIPANAGTSTSFTFTVSGNVTVPTAAADQKLIAKYKGLTGTYVALSATTTETHKQNALNTLRPYLRALDTAKTGTSATLSESNYSISLEYYHDATSGSTAAVSSKTITDIDDTEKIAAE